MLLRNYIEWTRKINEYKEGPKVANLDTWGFKELGKVNLPQITNLEHPTPGDEGYSSIRNESLTQWAKATWPFLKFLDAKIQVQKYNEECKPHLDFLGYYLEHVCETMPRFLQVEHSLDKPGLDVWRMFIAIEDQVDGQIFSVNNNEWTWKAGDCIRLNNWQALHWTKNESNIDRSLIKITGIKPQ
jgi:hypothetical protein|tara:strand:- start:651 stop:1208 length:558 start_codon:yes stop_codon:yes gene_type:complete